MRPIGVPTEHTEYTEKMPLSFQGQSRESHFASMYSVYPVCPVGKSGPWVDGYLKMLNSR